MLVERFLDPASPLPCPSDNALWTAVLKYPKTDPQSLPNVARLLPDLREVF